MPTYDYQCETCGHLFEVFQSMNDPKLKDCPLDDCDGAVKRLLGTGAGLIFKGGGFYETDYRSQSYKDGAKKDSEAGKPDGGSKSDKKPSGGSSEKPAKSGD
ncbi:MAG: FmdB family zinc ribbon protein [Verrucomicrobiota bacterium]